MIERRMPRIQEVVLAILRPEMPEVTFTSWIPDINQREYPLINVRRLGGLPDRVRPDDLDFPVIELTCYAQENLEATENLLLDAQWVLQQAVKHQIVTAAGYLHSYFQTMGPTQFDSGYADTWRFQSLIQLGLRPSQHESGES